MPGLSIHTLRYYERIDLLTPVARATNGHRHFSGADIERIKLLKRILETKMPLEHIKRYAGLVREGNESIPERGTMKTHREQVVR